MTKGPKLPTASTMKEIVHWTMGKNFLRGQVRNTDVLMYQDEMRGERGFEVKKIIVAGSKEFMRVLANVDFTISNKVYLETPAAPFLEIAMNPFDALCIAGVERPINLPLRFVYHLDIRLFILNSVFSLKVYLDEWGSLTRNDYACLAVTGQLHRPVH